MTLFSLEGRVALVTGASRGIGAGCAEVLAELGATVVVNYHRGLTEAEQVITRLKAVGCNAIALQADVSEPAEARQLVHRVIDQFGKLDIVVNNAGFNASPPVIMEMGLQESIERWHWTLNTNLASQFHISHEAIVGMAERHWGRIINISSISGVRGGLIGDVEYSASKAGILGLTRGLARYVAKKGITVNALAVGIIETESMHRTVSQQRLQSEIIPAIPVGRLGTPRDVGYLAGFLASDEAGWITGETLQINGGHHIAWSDPSGACMKAISTEIQTLPKTDVLVIGSGSAGATAAIAAAQEGASVRLVERYGFMGGTSTAVLDTFCGFYIHTADGSGRKVVGGVPDQVVDELHARRKAIIRTSVYWRAGNVITYCPHTLKVVWEQLAQAAGVRLLYHALVIDVVVQAGRVTGVIAATKGGMIRLEADTIIDASGDADVAFRSGVPCETPQDQPVQALTTTFRLANVDVERAQQMGRDALKSMMGDAIARGAYDLPRASGDVYHTPLPGVMATNVSRVSEVDPTDPEQLTQAEIEGRRQALEYTRFLCEQVPGYENAYLASVSTQIGIRESRRIFGEYRLTRQDVLEARRFDDAIAQCGWPFEDHGVGDATHLEYLTEGQTYDIPYRCLVPQQADGLLVAGRCLSADHDAHASVRVMAQCMAMGQAAGIAAAIAARRGIGVREVPVAQLQARLRAIGAVI